MAESKTEENWNSESVSRRDFLRVGSLAAVSMSAAGTAAKATATPSRPRSVIQLVMLGGPSQIDTFDPKPDASESIRGPFRSIATSVPGVRIGEHLPRIARLMDRLTLIRSLTHGSSPIHETGLQLIQTGRMATSSSAAPHFGAVAAHLLANPKDAPAFAVLPGLLGPTGVSISQGQTAGHLGRRYEAEVPVHHRYSNLARAMGVNREHDGDQELYGNTAFGRDCLRARRLVEAGTRVVTVNMATTVFNQVSWDCHGASPFSSFDDYARVLMPTFDRAFSALVEDLQRTGLLDTTLLIATGEFGRSPKINAQGGRDHWPGAWSALMVGSGVPGGRVIGKTDKHASEPIDRPVAPAELVATAYRALGIDPALTLASSGNPGFKLIEDDQHHLGLIA